MTETTLERAQRHVVEGQARIAAQEALIEKLYRNGHAHMLTEAHRFLDSMIVLHNQNEDHLARLKAQKR